MQVQHWGEMDPVEEDLSAFASDKYVPTAAKKPKLDEIRQRGDILPQDKHSKIELKSSLVTQTIEVMKQTEVLQSLIDTYSNKNGTSNYLLNPCQMIPEVDFPPENAADLIGEQKFQKPIWFMPTVDTAYSRGDPQAYPEISSNICRETLRKVMCGLLRLAGFTDCSEKAIVLLTDATEEFMKNFVTEYRGFYDGDAKLEKCTSLKLPPLEQAYFSMTGTSLTQVHNYYKHKVISRNRAEIGEFNSVLQDYDKLMKESQSSMQKQQQEQQNEFTGSDFLNILEMQPGDDATNNSNSMGNIVGEMLQELGGSNNSNISLSNVNSGQQQIISSNALYGLLEGQGTNVASTSAAASAAAVPPLNIPNPNVSASSAYQTNFDNA